LAEAWPSKGLYSKPRRQPQKIAPGAAAQQASANSACGPAASVCSPSSEAVTSLGGAFERAAQAGHRLGEFGLQGAGALGPRLEARNLRPVEGGDIGQGAAEQTGRGGDEIQSAHVVSPN
jgi:hypothetical protein